MKIEKLILEAFQSHKYTEIDFHPYFNCLIGSGNSGKTSIVRALAFVLYGQWDASWINHGEKVCRITLITDTQIKIIREKGEKVNKFIVNNGSSEQVYENFGIGVPTEIEQILGVFKVQLDSNEFLPLNISQQMDPLFLLSKPGSFKAKVLGKLSGAHLLDYVLRDLNKDKRSLSGEKQLRTIEELDLQKDLIQYERVEIEKTKLDGINDHIAQIGRKIEYVQKVKLLFSRVNLWKQQYTQECQEEAVLAGINLDRMQDLTTTVDSLQKIRRLKEKIRVQDIEIHNVGVNLVDLDDSKHQKIDEYVSLLQEAKKCPTCFNSVDLNQIDTIKTNL